LASEFDSCLIGFTEAQNRFFDGNVCRYYLVFKDQLA
jgi:hypothetical protein